MTAVRGQLPGRAGRVWLDRRVELASRGAQLLESKLRILTGLQERYALLAERTDSTWGRAMADLEVWTTRAGLVSGQRGLRLAANGEAEVEVTWQVTMGVRHPAAASCAVPDPAPGDAVPDSVALIEARSAAARALQAAVDHAVAARALASIEAEVRTTRRQLRAIETRWLPTLQQARARLAVDLDDQERDDALRMRWAARKGVP